MKHNFRLFRIVSIVALLLLVIPAVASAQEEEITCEHPRVVYLVEKSDASCQEIIDLVDSGVGFGQIMKAIVVAESMPEGSGTDWRDLLQAHLDGQGWGQLSHAYGLKGRFNTLDLSPEELLELRESGLGWGQIVHAQALASADIGVSFEEAVTMLQNGLGWGEIRAELGLENGPPPWAGQGKDKASNGQGNNPNQGNGKNQGIGHGQGQGNGHSQGNGNGQGGGNETENDED